MDMRFSTQEILQVAENVEQREMDFYLRASHQLADQDLKRLCGRLACWSLRHKKLWEQERQDLGPDQYTTEDETLFSHPGAMAGLTWFGLRSSSNTRAPNWTCCTFLLWEARQRVNDLMTFYEGLKGFIRDANALAMVDRILSEETRHFSYIEELLRTIPEIKTFSSTSEPQ